MNAFAFALELRQVCKIFGTTQILCGASLQIPQGQRYALIGPNGAGKSTLFNLISGRLALSSGAILLHGASINGRQPHEINRLGLSRSFQITNIFHRLSVFENLHCAVLWSLGYRYSFWQRLNGLKDAMGAACSNRRHPLQGRRYPRLEDIRNRPAGIGLCA